MAVRPSAKKAGKKAAKRAPAGKAKRREKPKITAVRQAQLEHLRQSMDEAAETAAASKDHIGCLADARLTEILVGMREADKTLVAAIKLAMERAGFLVKKTDATVRGDAEHPVGVVVVPGVMDAAGWQAAAQRLVEERAALRTREGGA